MLFVPKAAQTCAAFFFMALSLLGCAGPDQFGGSRQAVEQWGHISGFDRLTVDTPSLPVFALGRGGSSVIVHIYIEGDGAGWLTAYHPPQDPTPTKPIALALAAKDPWPTVVYLGRPCQYLDVQDLAACPTRYWTSHRFAPEIVDSYQQVLDASKKLYGASQLRLFGYSGGGVLAMLISARRDDVVQVITIASPISVAEWTAWHDVSPLIGSLDPASQTVGFPPSIHFVGERDGVVPREVVAPFAKKIGGRVRLMPDFDHECCWSRDWRRLMEEIR